MGKYKVRIENISSSICFCHSKDESSGLVVVVEESALRGPGFELQHHVPAGCDVV